MENQTITGTGHVIGATYRSAYWGGTYRVVRAVGEWGVEVECVTPGGGAYGVPGQRWQHLTALSRRDARIS
jgi:hypothetical protein